MQARQRLAQTKEDMHQATSKFVHDVKKGIEHAEEEAENLVEGAKEVVEEVKDAVEDVMPKMERVVSTMNRQYSIVHALTEEVKCCWRHAHWGWARSILGPNLLKPVDEDGEWAFIRGCFRSWTIGPLIQLFMLSFGSLLFPPLGFFLLLFLWERSYVTEIGSRDAVVRTARARERWVFVNGMCVDNNLGNANATQLSKLFHRQIGFFHNPTQGLLFDFIECMVGRTFNLQTPVSRSLARCLTNALKNQAFDKVILVVHSQGGIIASNAIDLLISRRVPIQNLEVYTFGSAADEFAQVYDTSTHKNYPFYEHFANDYDYVAQIGIFHWHCPGAVYTAPRDGHFFGDHYLPTFRDRRYKLYCGPKTAQPRLYSYLDTAEQEKAADAGKFLKKQKPSQPSCASLPRPSFFSFPPSLPSFPYYTKRDEARSPSPSPIPISPGPSSPSSSPTARSASPLLIPVSSSSPLPISPSPSPTSSPSHFSPSSSPSSSSSSSHFPIKCNLPVAQTAQM